MGRFLFCVFLQDCSINGLKSLIIMKFVLLVFINVCSYFSKAEVSELLDFISLLNVDVLFIEPKSVYDFRQYALDKDYFLFVPEE